MCHRAGPGGTRGCSHRCPRLRQQLQVLQVLCGRAQAGGGWGCSVLVRQLQVLHDVVPAPRQLLQVGAGQPPGAAPPVPPCPGIPGCFPALLCGKREVSIILPPCSLLINASHSLIIRRAPQGRAQQRPEVPGGAQTARAEAGARREIGGHEMGSASSRVWAHVPHCRTPRDCRAWAALLPGPPCQQQGKGYPVPPVPPVPPQGSDES